MYIYISKKQYMELEYEIVERKGIGHPDTLADALAEWLSTKYSKFTVKKYGAILHHNFDKVGLLGGTSYVTFGNGHLTNPIRVLLNGRASIKFGEEKIPIRKLLIKWTKDFFREKLPTIDVDDDLEFHYNLSAQSSPGKTYEKESRKSIRSRWFEPRGLEDLPELMKLFSNDTSLGVGYAPISRLEEFLIEIESTLTSNIYRAENPWIGTDIKIMGFRNKNSYFLTICIPQIANFVKNLNEYKQNLKKARNDINKILKKKKIEDYELNINTRDKEDLREIYLTATGSSIESGDEGLVGRGNRINGVISPMRPMSIEGVCGKNPVYHAGKLYYVIAFEIAQKIYKKYRIHNEVFLISQSGRDLTDPWIILVNIPKNFNKVHEIKKLIFNEINQISTLTNSFLKRKFVLH